MILGLIHFFIYIDKVRQETMSKQILVLFSILTIVAVSCEDLIPKPLEILYPPDTHYECNLTILDLDHDKLFREKFDVLEDNDPE